MFKKIILLFLLCIFAFGIFISIYNAVENYDSFFVANSVKDQLCENEYKEMYIKARNVFVFDIINAFIHFVSFSLCSTLLICNIKERKIAKTTE